MATGLSGELAASLALEEVNQDNVTIHARQTRKSNRDPAETLMVIQDGRECRERHFETIVAINTTPWAHALWCWIWTSTWNV